MRADHLWNRAKSVKISVGSDMTGGIDFGFNKRAPAEVQKPIRDFIS